MCIFKYRIILYNYSISMWKTNSMVDMHQIIKERHSIQKYTNQKIDSQNKLTKKANHSAFYFLLFQLH